MLACAPYIHDIYKKHVHNRMFHEQTITRTILLFRFSLAFFCLCCGPIANSLCFTVSFALVAKKKIIFQAMSSLSLWRICKTKKYTFFTSSFSYLLFFCYLRWIGNMGKNTQEQHTHCCEFRLFYFIQFFFLFFNGYEKV